MTTHKRFFPDSRRNKFRTDCEESDIDTGAPAGTYSSKQPTATPPPPHYNDDSGKSMQLPDSKRLCFGIMKDSLHALRRSLGSSA